MSNLSFHEINSWDKEAILYKFIPPGSKLVISDNSNIILIIEPRHGGTGVNLLDRIAAVLSKIKSNFTAFGKKMVMTQDDAVKLASILREQSKRLETMAATYNILATALATSKDNFNEVVKNTDNYMNDVLNNPFV